VGAEERRGHRAGGDDEGLDDEAAEDEGEDEGDENRLEGFFDVGGGAVVDFFLFGFGRRGRR
jgi:hypothetical protein